METSARACNIEAFPDALYSPNVPRKHPQTPGTANLSIAAEFLLK